MKGRLAPYNGSKEQKKQWEDSFGHKAEFSLLNKEMTCNNQTAFA